MKYRFLVWIIENWFLVRLITDGNVLIPKLMSHGTGNYDIDGGSGPLGPPLSGPLWSWSSLLPPLGFESGEVRKDVGRSKNITIAKTTHIIAIIMKLLSPLSWAGPGSPSYEQTGHYKNILPYIQAKKLVICLSDYLAITNLRTFIISAVWLWLTQKWQQSSHCHFMAKYALTGIEITSVCHDCNVWSST